MRRPAMHAARRAGCSLVLLAATGLAQAADKAPVQTPAKPVAKSATQPAIKPAAKPTVKPAPTPGAAPLAAATAPAEPLNPGQLDVADRVLTGVADCEFKQQISVQPVAGQHGHFEVRFQKARYVMVPRETATGAVRLEDPRSGMLWIQIPAKSMLMDSRRGQRVVDHCMQAEQRAAVAAVKDAATSLGIEPVSPTAAAPSLAATATATATATAPLASAAASAPSSQQP
ncbi:hypothetical protein AACH10_02055 [Ideonella sp. DXS22W]|uniref:Uncharacterized protein n=1 Tax=Pseudaquabacterium inlustre TaxID=2984192 RepID=A0ABU9CES8_9BURK